MRSLKKKNCDARADREQNDTKRRLIPWKFHGAIYILRPAIGAFIVREIRDSQPGEKNEASFICLVIKRLENKIAGWMKKREAFERKRA